MKMKNTGI